ncbi:alpha/beta-hydrolase [Lentithecium fluviatile CBS 122367]|uniref:Carboxylic ester hydrolase n=1 Tax=Lentithecium fluviatile CBS 122367 TaxID=1168545 RepID=A0A6G1JF78_9PLEO|nr:alpha/beta-hydrolase [Lentithecium fluviatile CBS 122367]
MMKGLIGAIALLSGVTASPLVSRATVTVDLGYSKYQGTQDVNNSINVFKGIRYAAPPLGKLRFAAPQAPATNKTTQLATSDPPVCPQTGAGAATPTAYGFTSALGNEDCLFLNVYAPSKAKNLPVFFWIHGGGYGLFSATDLDPTEFIAKNNNGFIAVIIQYRLGAFGFLSSDDVKKGGALNAGLLDMNFALQWVQKYIKKFGGDPNRVTVAGESAGAGAVLYQAMAYGGKQSLFQNLISASPWIPYQYKYNDAVPTKAYNDFVSAAGCSSASSKLTCLRNASSEVVQKASFKVSEASPWGSFAFVPVTDGKFIKQLPTEALSSGALSGKRILAGNLANEGVPLSPYTNTLEDFRAYIDTTFPNFSDDDKAALEEQYSFEGDDQPVDLSLPLYSTSGTGTPTALNQSNFGTGMRQRTFNVFAEYAFDCPSYWMASAFPTAWKYQFSALPSYHGFDLQALWSGTSIPGQSYKNAFRKVWGNFIVKNDPRITLVDAQGGGSNLTAPTDGAGKVDWPVWSEGEKLLDLNATGGVPVQVNATEDLKYVVYVDPGVTNVIKLADAYDWEGGRGARCEWWLEQAKKVPY